ncbi:DUF6686 family protein [Fodinibius halophilus]|uniref:Uncharacterized protein n=1 Tax=Fodinibius halophilus TaxID=1736908 RepID=A0A6M1T159_9BACT|nr:DUF6686 family protein [Fodinibius halophilus]NGP87707.1 hypothetical protein [Fodinibius halophilus]
MHNQDRTVLTQNGDIIIEQCSCCDNIVFIYRNILLKFTPEVFQDFTTSFRKLNFERRSYVFEDGSEKMLVNTPQKEIQLCFTKGEFKQLCQALQEATLMLEVHEILCP